MTKSGQDQAYHSGADNVLGSTDNPAESCSLGPLPDYIGYNLRRAQLASFRHLDRIAGALDLSPGQFSLLTFLGTNPGVSQKTVSRELGVDTSTLSPVLAALSERGLVRRSRAEHDRRNYAISLTDEGEDLLAAMRTQIDAQETVMGEALLPGELERLLDMLRRITVALNSA